MHTLETTAFAVDEMLIMPTTPSRGNIKQREATTRKENPIFTIYDLYISSKSLVEICRETTTEYSTAKRWLKSRRELGSAALRRRRRMRSGLERSYTLDQERIEQLTSPSRNPVRKRKLALQCAYYDLLIKARALQINLCKRTYTARYVMAFVKKKVSKRNHIKREEYGWDHKDHTVDNYRAFVI